MDMNTFSLLSIRLGESSFPESRAYGGADPDTLEQDRKG
jgi:hypothetical protein